MNEIECSYDCPVRSQCVHSTMKSESSWHPKYIGPDGCIHFKQIQPHFENGRWVSLPTQIDRIMRPLPVTKFGISISHLTPIFEKGRHIRDDKVIESLGEFTSEQIKILKFIGVL